MTNIVLNGNAYSDDGSSGSDMQGGGHRQFLLPMLSDAMIQAAGGATAASAQALAAAASALAALNSQGAAAGFAQDALDSFTASDLIGSGWSAVTRTVADGARQVLQVTDWTGGKGPKPATGYIGSTGLVATAALATDLRGAVAYSALTGKPTLGTAAALNVPATAAAAASALQVVRGDDPRLAEAALRGTQLFTGSQSIPKSLFGTADYVFAELWAGGASGSATAGSGAAMAGGEGGDYQSALVRVSDLSTDTSLVIGSGGASAVSTGTTVNGNAGGDSYFGAHLRANGGLAPSGAGVVGPSRQTLSAKTGGDGGGDSGTTLLTRRLPGAGGDSVQGGGGGGGGLYAAGGASQLAGAGGAGVKVSSSPSTGGNGSIPSGGGGGASITVAGTATSGAGARGQARLTWW